MQVCTRRQKAKLRIPIITDSMAEPPKLRGTAGGFCSDLSIVHQGIIQIQCFPRDRRMIGAQPQSHWNLWNRSVISILLEQLAAFECKSLQSFWHSL